ncbi:hypothetical protein ACRAWF_26935 [Streptomyces sp. L7]
MVTPAHPFLPRRRSSTSAASASAPNFAPLRTLTGRVCRRPATSLRPATDITQLRRRARAGDTPAAPAAPYLTGDAGSAATPPAGTQRVPAQLLRLLRPRPWLGLPAAAHAGVHQRHRQAIMRAQHGPTSALSPRPSPH